MYKINKAKIVCICLSALLLMACSKTYIDKINLIPGATEERSLDHAITAFTVADSNWTAAIGEDSILIY